MRRRLLPHGPGDLVRQVLLFGAAFAAYRLTRGAVDDGQATADAFANARALIDLERALGIFVEPDLQSATAGHPLVRDAAGWVYVNAQTSMTLGGLAWLYLFRNAAFYFVRNMFAVAFSVALAGYALYPTAPPRFLPEWGFHDTVADFTGIPADSVTVDALFNPYAAVPSMHVGFALMIGWPLALLVRRRAARAFWLAYPLLVTLVTVVTANHFLADAVLGGLAAGAGALAAASLARLGPASWAFGRDATRPAPAPVPAPAPA